MLRVRSRELESGLGSCCRPGVGRYFVLLLTLALVSTGGCRRDGTEDELLVFAAASLVEPFEALARAFEARHPGTSIALHFAGSPTLAAQIREGAPAEVFASADLLQAQLVTETGRALGPPQPFATNRLAILTSRGNPKQIRGLADLTRSDVQVALGAPGVPIGHYARECLARAALTVPTVSDEPSVTALLTKVRLGEVDAAIAYVTDARRFSEAIAVVRIPDEHQVVATLHIAALRGDGENESAQRFVAFVTSAEGRAILESLGFGPP